MGYPGPTSTAHKAIVKGSFTGALDSELAQKRENVIQPHWMKHCILLWDLKQSVRLLRRLLMLPTITCVIRTSVFVELILELMSSVLAKMNEMQSRLDMDKDLKAVGDCMTDVEIAVRRPRQSHVTSPPVRVWTSSDPQRASTPPTAPVPSHNSHPATTSNVTLFGWRRGVVVSGVRRWTKLTHVGPGYNWDGWPSSGGYTISVCNQPSRSTQPCIPPGSLNRVPASAGVKAGTSPLPGGR